MNFYIPQQRKLIIFFISIFLLSGLVNYGQTSSDTSNIRLQPVEVKVYFSRQPSMSLTSTTQVISAQALTQQSGTSMVSAINTVPGIRMEERSPGSYRLAMRGSMIRSPFGVRNTKIYIDEFPMTDAGGNTYLNLIDPHSIGSIHVIKGPDGSVFGANSGGVVQITPKGFGELEDGVEAQITSGSFGLFAEHISWQKQVNQDYQFSVDQSFIRSDGYRDNTALNKKTFQTAQQWNYNNLGQLRLFALYSDLYYQTPGGLNATQYADNPKQSRPSTGATPSAKEQKAGIYNKTWLGGLTNAIKLSDNLSHTISIFGSYTDFENPFITNYELRKEKNLGARTYFSWQQSQHLPIQWHMQVGAETYWGWSDRDNYGNDKGTPTDRLDQDELDNQQINIFYRTMVSFWHTWNIEGSIGYNDSKIDYQKHFPIIGNPNGNINFAGTWMPRVATSYRFSNTLAARASFSRGYSPPTIEEIRPSDRIINKDLQPETGTNTEAGLRYNLPSQHLLVDLAAYTYRMKNGIIRQINEEGDDYFVNAGNIQQKGVELSLWTTLLSPRIEGWIHTLATQHSLGYNHYRFGNYIVGDKDFSNNKVTAVPDWTVSQSVHLGLVNSTDLMIQYNYTGSMPLDDSNLVFAKNYHLLQAKLSTQIARIRKTAIQVFVGGDNLLNQKYSLGNDINAFGGRYFNAAPTVNFYAGIKVGVK